MTALEDLLNDPDCKPRDPAEKQNKLKAHEKQVKAIRHAKAAEEEAVRQRKKRHLEHEASLARSKEEDAVNASQAEPETTKKSEQKRKREPAVFRRVLFPVEVLPLEASIDCTGVLGGAALELSESAGIPSSSFAGGLVQELISGRWVLSHCIMQGHCSADLAGLLFDTMVRAEALGVAAAAQQQLSALIQRAGTPPSANSSKPQIPHSHLDMQWMPDTAAFLTALSTLGFKPSPDSHAAYCSQQDTQHTPQNNTQDEADIEPQILGKVQLLMKLLISVCQHQATSSSKLLHAEGLCELLKCLLQISLDPCALALATDVEEAIKAIVEAFDDGSWSEEVARAAQGLAAVGGSHRGALAVIKHLSLHHQRLSQLRQHAAAALLCSLGWCQVSQSTQLLADTDMQGIIRKLPWFGDGPAGAELAHRACRPHERPVDGWELHTALEAINIMLGPLLAEGGEAGMPSKDGSDPPAAGLDPEFAKELSRLLQHLDSGLRRANFYDHAARASGFLACKLRERILSSMGVD